MAQQAAALWGDVEGSADGTTGDASKRGAVGVGVSEVVRERCWPNSSDRRGAGHGKSAVGTADAVGPDDKRAESTTAGGNATALL